MKKKVIKLTESELKDYIKKVISEQINPDYSKGTHDIDARGEKYLPLAQKLAKQLKDMKFAFNGKNIFTNTFDGFHVTVEFNNRGVQISKRLEKNTGMPNLQAPLILPFEKLTEMNFMKYVVDYVHGTPNKGDLSEQSSDIEMERLKRERDRLKKELANLEAQIISTPKTKKSRTTFDDYSVKRLTESGFRKVSNTLYKKDVSSSITLKVELYAKGCSAEYPGFTFFLNDNAVYQGCPDECWVWFGKNLRKYEN